MEQIANFIFRPEIQEGIAKGIYKIVVTKEGVPIGLVRGLDGKFVAHAIGALVERGDGYKPLLEGLGKSGLNLIKGNPLSPILSGMQMLQVHRGFQATYKKIDAVQSALKALQSSVVILQATTAVIGVGVVVGVALSAVNLYHTLKLRKEISQLRLEVKDGLIDLKEALKYQGDEIIQQIDQVAKDIKFEAHRLVLIRAYGKFQQALQQIKTSLLIEDLSTRNITLGNAQLLLADALADYNNPQLLEQTNAAGHLRRVECAWAIEQTMTLTYQLQNAPAAVSDRLSYLQEKIRQDTLIVAERCETESELDFIFPEITRIYAHDLTALQLWQNQVDWQQSLSAEELNQLNSIDSTDEQAATNSEISGSETELEPPPEQLLYEKLREKSHYRSLRDQLRFLVQPNLRRSHELYVSEQAVASNYKALAPSNWQEIPDLTVANLYWYFKSKQSSEEVIV